MIIPDGVTVVFDGGSFTGTTSGGSIELKNGAVFVGSSVNENVSFGTAFSFPATGNMVITNGTVSFGTLNIAASGSLSISSSTTVTGSVSLVNKGTFTITGNSYVNIADVDGSDGTTSISCAKATGTTWRLATLSISGSAASYIDGVYNLTSLTLGSPLIVDQLVIFLGSVITMSGTDTFLTVKSGLSVSSSGDATTIAINGDGYIALPDSDTRKAEFVIGSGIKFCDYGAGITAIALSNTSDTTATLVVTRTDDSVPYLIEKRLGTASSYTTVDLTCDDDSSVINTVFGQTNVVRVFDGINFISDVAYVADITTTELAQSDYYVYTLGNYSFNGTVKPFRYEPIVFLGQVQNQDTGNLIKRSEVSSVSLTMYKYDSYAYSASNISAITSWTNVSIDKRCFFETASAFDIWDKDGSCNFCWIPNQNTEVFTSNSGKYLASFKATLLSGTTETFSLIFEVL